MEYKKIEGINKKSSRFVYGLGADKITADYASAKECMDMAYEAGFTVFDTANCYGNSEKNFGKWLSEKKNREETVIIDKGCNPNMIGSNDEFSARQIRSHVEESLRRLRTDYIDIYILHRDDKTKNVDEIVDVLNELKKEGKIIKFGGSNWHYTRVREANEYAGKTEQEGFSVASPCFNMVEMINDPWGGSEHICGKEKEEDRKWYRENKITIFPYSSLARGYLSGKYKTGTNIEDVLWWGPIKEYHHPKNEERLKKIEEMAKRKNCTVSQIALAWLLASENEVYPIISPTTKKHIEENIKAFDVKLDKEELI